MRVAHDGALLPIIKEAKKSQRERNFYVVHLMGNHMDYKKRYPEEFDKFKSDDIALPFTQKQKVALACCDNSVLYNDYVVNEIHRMRTASSVYLSDHGENIYEQNGLIGHNINTRFTYEIPLLFISSKSFIADHAEL